MYIAVLILERRWICFDPTIILLSVIAFHTYVINDIHVRLHTF